MPVLCEESVFSFLRRKKGAESTGLEPASGKNKTVGQSADATMETRNSTANTGEWIAPYYR
jgi:hypothetical protein